MKRFLKQVGFHLVRSAYIFSIASFCLLSIGILPAAAIPEYPTYAFNSSSLGDEFSPMSKNYSSADKEQIEEQKKSAEKDAEYLLNEDAIAAVQQTKEAILDLEANNPNEALQHLETATGKIAILLAREPSFALIPISSTVAVIDTAPLSRDSAEELRNHVAVAIEKGDYAEARELLDNMISEVRTQIVNVPLVTHSKAMKLVAALIDADKLEEAKEVLNVALSMLFIVERTQPIPVINARTSLIGAVAIAPEDHEAAIRLLEDAREDLRLAKALGYLSKDKTYGELDKQIDDIESKIKRNIDSGSVFKQVEDKLSSFIEKFSL